MLVVVVVMIVVLLLLLLLPDEGVDGIMSGTSLSPDWMDSCAARDNQRLPRVTSLRRHGLPHTLTETQVFLSFSLSFSRLITESPTPVVLPRNVHRHYRFATVTSWCGGG